MVYGKELFRRGFVSSELELAIFMGDLDPFTGSGFSYKHAVVASAWAMFLSITSSLCRFQERPAFLSPV